MLFDAPARQAFVLDLVSRDDLTNAIALNATISTRRQSLGLAAGGMIYGFTGRVGVLRSTPSHFGYYQSRLLP